MLLGSVFQWMPGRVNKRNHCCYSKVSVSQSLTINKPWDCGQHIKQRTQNINYRCFADSLYTHSPTHLSFNSSTFLATATSLCANFAYRSAALLGQVRNNKTSSRCSPPSSTPKCVRSKFSLQSQHTNVWIHIGKYTEAHREKDCLFEECSEHTVVK